MPTACEILMNSFLSGSGLCISVALYDSVRESRTGTAVHEKSALLEELGRHTVRLLAIRHPSAPSDITYSANSLTFSMATGSR